MKRQTKTGKDSNEKSHILKKCIWKHCRKMVKVDHSMDIPGFYCKKHDKIIQEGKKIVRYEYDFSKECYEKRKKERNQNEK